MTGAVRQALREKKKRLELRTGSKEERRQKLREALETEIWSQIPSELLDKDSMAKEEHEWLEERMAEADSLAMGAPTL